MPSPELAYPLPAPQGGTARLSLAILSDRRDILAELLEDALALGLRAEAGGAPADLLDREHLALCDLFYVDCPHVGAAELAALSAIDLRAEQSGARLIVATRLDSLDTVFACLDRSEPHLLVDPSRGERIVALGAALMTALGSKVRELSDENRLILLQLTEQVSQIARQLEQWTDQVQVESEDGGAFRFESPKRTFTSEEEPGERLIRATRPPLPDPRLVRQIIRQRQLRARFFDGDLFADPAWDMLLDLTAARAEHSRVSVTSLCIASGVPPTTALRWIAQMTEAGLLERVEDEIDKRRAFITLTDKAADAMARYFAELGKSAGKLV
jgi:DNA-binding transcriptional ArsR family regulator